MKARSIMKCVLKSAIISAATIFVWIGGTDDTFGLFDIRYIANLLIFFLVFHDLHHELRDSNISLKQKIITYFINTAVIGIVYLVIIGIIKSIVSATNIILNIPFWYILIMYLIYVIYSLELNLMRYYKYKRTSIILKIIGLITITILFIIFKIPIEMGLIYTLSFLDVVGGVFLSVKCKKSSAIQP